MAPTPFLTISPPQDPLPPLPPFDPPSTPDTQYSLSLHKRKNKEYLVECLPVGAMPAWMRDYIQKAANGLFSEGSFVKRHLAPRDGSGMRTTTPIWKPTPKPAVGLCQVPGITVNSFSTTNYQEGDTGIPGVGLFNYGLEANDTMRKNATMGKNETSAAEMERLNDERFKSFMELCLTVLVFMWIWKKFCPWPEKVAHLHYFPPDDE